MLSREDTLINKIGLVYNLKSGGRESDADEEYDEPETIAVLSETVKQMGFEVLGFEQGSDLAYRMNQTKPDFVINIAEGIGRGRGRESQVPCIMETMHLPYSGSDPVALGVTLDKYFCSKILRSSGVPVAMAFSAYNKKTFDEQSTFIDSSKRYIVKPRWEGSSKGIFNNSIVYGHDEILKKVTECYRLYGQPAVIEEYIPGDEVTVGVCGNVSPGILAVMQIRPRVKKQDFIYSLEVKRDWRKQVEYCLYKSDQRIMSKIQNYALKAFDVLGIHDLCRIDFRVDADGVPKIIDINPLPGLSPEYSDLPIMCGLAGMPYKELVSEYLSESLKRYGLLAADKQGGNSAQSAACCSGK